MKVNKHELNVIRKKAEILKNAGKYEEALSLYNKLAQEKDYSADAYISISMIHHYRKEDDLALEAVLNAYQADPKSGPVNFMVGQAYYSKGQMDNAIKYLTESVKVMPGNSHGIRLLCWIYEDRDDYESIYRLLKRTIKSNPLNGELCMRYASAILMLESLRDNKSLHEALLYLDKAFSLGDREPLINYFRGKAYFFLREWKKCIHSLESYLSMKNDDDQEIREMLAFSAGASGDLVKAELYALEIVKLDPERGAVFLEFARRAKS